MMRRHLLALLLLAGCAAAGEPRRPQVDRVVLVSIDGLRPDAIEAADAKTLKSLIAGGVSADHAETIRPSLTLPSHTSMLTGLDFRRHGVVWNNYRPGHIAHPTIFHAAKEAGLSTAALFSKDKFHYLCDPGVVGWIHGPPPPQGPQRKEDYTDPAFAEKLKAAERAASRVPFKPSPEPMPKPTPKQVRTSADALAAAFAKEWPGRGPGFTFVHLREPDSAGHKRGWMSPAYLEAVRESDRALGLILSAIDRSPHAGRTAILVTADHGGSRRHHFEFLDPDKAVNVRIPWILRAPGRPAGKVIDTPVRTYDTAPTILSLLGLPVPGGIDGRPVPLP